MLDSILNSGIQRWEQNYNHSKDEVTYMHKHPYLCGMLGNRCQQGLHVTLITLQLISPNKSGTL